MSRFSALVVVILFLWATTSLDSRAQSFGAQPSVPESYLLQVGRADSLYSRVLGEIRPLWIHLPNQGRLIEGQSYPVIYLLDGGSLLGGLAAIQEFYGYFRMPEMIVVGISNRENRTRDLTPSSIETRNGAGVHESGGSELFTRFLSEELIPFIDSKYQTNEHRTLIGHSFAGLFTINTLAHHPDLFKNYIALDPSVDWDDMQWLNAELPGLTTSTFENKGLFVAVSNEIIRFSDTLTLETVASDTTEFSTGIRSLLILVEALSARQEAGLHFDWAFYEQDIHGSVPLIGMRDGLVFLYDFWELKKPSLYNDPNTPPDVLADLIRSQNRASSKGMGYPAGMEWGMLDMLGQMALDAEGYHKARAIFEVAVEFYPENEMAHAALMKACVLLGDRECALTHAQKADALSGDSNYVESLTH